jgi:hypothetical protein
MPRTLVSRAAALAVISGFAYLATPATGRAAGHGADHKASPPMTSELAVPERTVVLPPYVVSAMRVQKHPWRHGAIDGIEVLTRGDDEQTHWVLDALRRGTAIEDAALPAGWLPGPARPYTVIIDDSDVSAARTAELAVDPVAFAAPPDAFAWGNGGEAVRVWHDHFNARDDDTYAANIDVRDINPTSQALGWLGTERLSRCAPPLPVWLIAGITGSHCGIFREGFVPLANEAASWMKGATFGDQPRQFLGPGLLWDSAEETQLLLQKYAEFRRLPKRPPRLPPNPGLRSMAEIFAGPPADAKRRLRWESQAALFVRWGLFPPDNAPDRRDQFIRFVEHCRRQPASDALLREHFGFSDPQMVETLATYLPLVLAQPLVIPCEPPVKFPEPMLKVATAGDIGRILGDWLRMQANSQRTQNPAMRERLLDAAASVLQRAYDRDTGRPVDAMERDSAAKPELPSPSTAPGKVVRLPDLQVSATRLRDPELLATVGLLADDGQSDSALDFLERAARMGTVRPRAYVTLSRLHLANALGSVAAGQTLTPAQVAYVLAPLDRLPRDYASVEALAVVVHAWARCAKSPERAQADEIVAAARRHPQHSRLLLRAARLCAEAGYTEQARAVLEIGTPFAAQAELATDYARARTALVDAR